MGRKKKGFKAGSSSSLCESQNFQKNSVVVEIDDKEKYDASNPLVWIPEKKKTKVKVKEQNIPKPLSKKQRKKLEKVLESKKKKLNRADLLKKLSEVQATSEELRHLTSTSDMQTFGIKRLTNEYQTSAKRQKISNIRGINRKGECSSSDSESQCDDNEVSSSEAETEDESEKKEEVFDCKSDASESEKLSTNETENKEKSVSGCKSDAEKNETLSTNETENKEKLVTENSEKEEITNHFPTVFVPVYRKPEIQAARESLPIYSEEQPLLEAIRENPVVIVHGETGSGKTTQVPQFLYEAGFSENNMLIGITEPRRIAAMTMAARVGEEMDMPNAVSYHIRYEKTVNPETRIKFMTDGVLLQEIKRDFFLSKYSVIIIDEAHERSVFSDVLIGLLSRIVRRDQIKKKKYPPLKLIIMSATMCVEEFMDNRRLFKTTPHLFKVGSRQYPVQIHFSKITPENYIEAVYRKVCKVHRQLPAGSILVFLTGEKEIMELCKMLRKTFPVKNFSKEIKEPVQNTSKKKKHKTENHTFGPDIDLDKFSIEPEDSVNNNQLEDNFRIEKFEDATPLYTLPLFSVLPFEEQEKVFNPPPTGSRLCVVATNVAETSITIPGLKYVVDSGKVKTKVYNQSGGISRFVITWCSKASANQRAGRAGRTEGGHTYRLYSSAVFDNEFPDYTLPEIQRIPADDVLLQMKALGIPKVVDFPFPSPPDVEALKAAEKRLLLLEALEEISGEKARRMSSKDREFSAPVSGFGRTMALFPLSPRYSAMLLLSKKHKCIPHVLAVVCAMSVPEIFRSKVITSEESEETKIVWDGIQKIGLGEKRYHRFGDAMVLLRVVALYEESVNKSKFCNKKGIRQKAMIDIQNMRLQLSKEMTKVFEDLTIPSTLQLEPPTEELIENMRLIVAAGLIDHVAKKLPDEEGKKDKSLKNAYQCLELDEPVFIHPSSILFNELPQYIVYREIIHTSKYYMKGIVEVEDYWLCAVAPSLCEFSEPRKDPPPYYDVETDKIIVTMDAKFGRWSWDICAEGMAMPKGQLKYKWFCYFLLDGQVYPFIKNYSQFLSPSTVFKQWAITYRRDYIALLNALIVKEVDSKRSLENEWRKDNKYLLNELLAILPSHKQLEFQVHLYNIRQSLIDKDAS